MEERASGGVYWITGLPGVGKATLARTLAAHLTAQGRAVLRLHGDRLGPVLGPRYGHGASDRNAIALTYARLCHEFSSQGLDVVCATVSMVGEAQAWARSNIPDCREIYLRASVETLAARLPKGLIAAGLAGRLRNVPGVDLRVEEPDGPQVTVEDDGTLSPDAVAEQVKAALWPPSPAP